MTEEESKEAFLDRWSRRKQERTREPATPVAPQPASQPAEAKPAAPLQAVEDLKPDSDFKPFMDPRVESGTRRSALKKLFTNAHFSAIDPFEPYSVDLTGEDPIPEKMLKSLEHAKRLLFDEPEKVAEAQAQTEAPEPAPSQTQETDLQNDAGKQDA